MCEPFGIDGRIIDNKIQSIETLIVGGKLQAGTFPCRIELDYGLPRILIAITI